MATRTEETREIEAKAAIASHRLAGRGSAMTADFDVSALPCGLLAQYFYSLLAYAKGSESK
jgi:hypothetical protein